MDRAQHRIPVISEEAPGVLIGADDFVLNTETNLSNEIAVIISADGRIEHMTPPFSRLFIGKRSVAMRVILLRFSSQRHVKY